MCYILHGSNFVRFSRGVVACCHVGRLQATTAWSLISQVGLSHPWRFLHHPSLGWLDLTPHQALPFPFVHQTLSVSLCFFYIYYVLSSLSALQIPWRITRNTSITYFLWFSLDAKIGLSLGKDLALVELGRRQCVLSSFLIDFHFLFVRLLYFWFRLIFVGGKLQTK